LEGDASSRGFKESERGASRGETEENVDYFARVSPSNWLYLRANT